MNREALLQLIYKFYPRNISSFNAEYNETSEIKKLSKAMAVPRKDWQNFIFKMEKAFGSDYIRDRSDEEPSNRCVIFIQKDNLLFEFVLHISLLVKLYAYYVKKHLVFKEAIYTKEIDMRENDVFEEIEEEGRFIIQSLKMHFAYSILSKNDYNLIVPDISTKNKDLGQATIYNAIFSDTVL